jgi:hypothetical protein
MRYTLSSLGGQVRHDPHCRCSQLGSRLPCNRSHSSNCIGFTQNLYSSLWSPPSNTQYAVASTRLVNGRSRRDRPSAVRVPQNGLIARVLVNVALAYGYNAACSASGGAWHSSRKKCAMMCYNQKVKLVRTRCWDRAVAGVSDQQHSLSAAQYHL